MNLDDFEQSRRERETRNERLICGIVGCLLLAASLAHLGLRMIPGFRPQPPSLTIAIEIAGSPGTIAGGESTLSALGTSGWPLVST
jgi:hypothetical protein